MQELIVHFGNSANSPKDGGAIQTNQLLYYRGYQPCFSLCTAWVEGQYSTLSLALLSPLLVRIVAVLLRLSFDKKKTRVFLTATSPMYTVARNSVNFYLIALNFWPLCISKCASRHTQTYCTVALLFNKSLPVFILRQNKNLKFLLQCSLKGLCCGILQLLLLALRTVPVFLCSDCDTTSQKPKFLPHVNEVAPR